MAYIVTISPTNPTNRQRIHCDNKYEALSVARDNYLTQDEYSSGARLTVKIKREADGSIIAWRTGPGTRLHRA